MMVARWVLAVIISGAIWSTFFYFLSPGTMGILPSTGGANLAVNALTAFIVTLALRKLLVGPQKRKWWMPLVSIPLGALVWGILTSVVFAWLSTIRRDGSVVDYHNLSKFPLLAVYMAMSYYLVFTYPLAYLNQLFVSTIIASNQSSEPTLSSGTPPAGQESRPR